jgi:hypothetical protein
MIKKSNYCTPLLWWMWWCCIVQTRHLPRLHGYPKSALLHSFFSHIASLTIYCSWDWGTPRSFATMRRWCICYAMMTPYRLVATFRQALHSVLKPLHGIIHIVLWRSSKPCSCDVMASSWMFFKVHFYHVVQEWSTNTLYSLFWTISLLLWGLTLAKKMQKDHPCGNPNCRSATCCMVLKLQDFWFQSFKNRIKYLDIDNVVFYECVNLRMKYIVFDPDLMSLAMGVNMKRCHQLWF